MARKNKKQVAEETIAEVAASNGAHPLSIAELDMRASMDPAEYKRRIRRLQEAIVRLQRKVVKRGMPVLIIFEGVDAAGKGGAIKRLTKYLDPRWVRVHSLSRPSSYEQAYHWIKRYFSRLPRRGQVVIFDDYSWYARMLVEPIERLCTKSEYDRAPQEIRELERWLADSGYCIVKLWIQVDADEQVRRFKSRQNDPLKAWKLTPDDWRTSEMYHHYMRYADTMFAATDTDYAPWTLIAGNDKLHARVLALEAVVRALRRWQPGSTSMSMSEELHQ
jgi:polyphosphate kinase 2 (PPK2 family)